MVHQVLYSINVTCSPGSNADRHRPSADPAAASPQPACDEPQEDDDKSVESYNTAATSLSLGHVCKICHCGEEVNI